MKCLIRSRFKKIKPLLFCRYNTPHAISFSSYLEWAFLKRFFSRLFKALISVKLAVIVILVIAIFSAVGTFYESKYDAEYAQKRVYHSLLMYSFMGLMVLQLICVMIDRWPWKKHHTAFLLAHMGIIITLLGSLVTRYMGIDGSMAFKIGEKSRYVTMAEKELMVYASFDGQKFIQADSRQVDFLLDPPQETPVIITLGSEWQDHQIRLQKALSPVSW